MNKDIQLASHFSKVADFFGRLTFVPYDPDGEKIAARISKQELQEDHDDTLDALVSCMQVLRGFGEVNVHLRDEIIDGLEIVLQDLKELS